MSPKSRSRSLRAIALALFLVALACGEKGDPARRTIDEIVAAAEMRDAGAVVERLGPDFQAADGSGRADAETTLRRYLAAYERLGVRISDLTLERAAGAARARFRAELSGTPRKVGGLEGILPRSSTYRFDLRLAPASDGGRWLVTWASWEQTQ
ncbi:MAG TPA: hypothetical protein VGS98_07030 [Thermoanaerobaculia bacterium]|nr:hypothetical protein [Thermoanaerobaculia bacterium]